MYSEGILYGNFLRGNISRDILDILDRYNFTVKEGEVAIDPEILGDVIENSMGKNDRKSKGVYYTPREIVCYMCQQSLVNYLDTAIGSVIARRDIEDFICRGEFRVIGKHAQSVDEKLSAIKICDPAIGSGAFAVGMMQEIVKARNVLTAYIADKAGRSIYDLKRHYIQESLYGVDSDADAIEITKLRLWLCLMVDGQVIEPLANLDYKVRQGNSLIGDLDVFRDSGGFDVVITNPPYISTRESKKKGISDEEKRYFRKYYKLVEYQINLYHLFIERGANLLKANGCLCYIVPNNWLTVGKNKKLREFVLGQSDITIINFNIRVFKAAVVNSAIIIFRKSANNRHIDLYEYTDGTKFIKRVGCDFLLSQRDSIINIEAFKSDGVLELVGKIESRSVPLSSVASVKTGLVAYQTGKGNPPQTDAMKKNRVYHVTQKVDETYLKYLRGRDVCRYRIGWSGEYLRYGDNLASPRKDFHLYSGNRILVRQIPARPPYCIHACLIKETALNDCNSMNIINIQESPECVLGILNSRLTSFWFVYRFGKLQQRILPQFKVGELSQFPLPKNRAGRSNEIAEIANRILSLRGSEVDTSGMEAEIDQLVYGLYDLTADEIKIIEGRAR